LVRFKAVAKLGEKRMSPYTKAKKLALPVVNKISASKRED
jgi:hypothetical protein